MTDEQAYAAMFHFLKDHYQRSPSEELGALLGSLSLLDDGRPADAPLWNDWGRAVQHAKEGCGADRLRIDGA